VSSTDPGITDAVESPTGMVTPRPLLAVRLGGTLSVRLRTPQLVLAVRALVRREILQARAVARRSVRPGGEPGRGCALTARISLRAVRPGAGLRARRRTAVDRDSSRRARPGRRPAGRLPASLRHVTGGHPAGRRATPGHSTRVAARAAAVGPAGGRAVRAARLGHRSAHRPAEALLRERRLHTGGDGRVGDHRVAARHDRRRRREVAGLRPQGVAPDAEQDAERGAHDDGHEEVHEPEPADDDPHDDRHHHAEPRAGRCARGRDAAVVEPPGDPLDHAEVLPHDRDLPDREVVVRQVVDGALGILVLRVRAELDTGGDRERRSTAGLVRD
jgi:hypothetical protein